MFLEKEKSDHFESCSKINAEYISDPSEKNTKLLHETFLEAYSELKEEFKEFLKENSNKKRGKSLKSSNDRSRKITNDKKE